MKDTRMFLITVSRLPTEEDLTDKDWSISGMHLARDEDAGNKEEALAYFHRHVPIKALDHFHIECEVVDWSDPRTREANDIIPW